MSPLPWTSKSLEKLSAALRDLKHEVCPNVVGKLPRGMDYSPRSNRKTRVMPKACLRHDGSHHPDRDAQFQYPNRQMKAHLAEGSPVISIDAKKKELVGLDVGAYPSPT